MTLAGDLALGSLILFHSLAMNGGVLHALESCSEAQIKAAVDGYRFFGQRDVATVVEGGVAARHAVQDGGDTLEDLESLEINLDREYYEHVPEDGTLATAFEQVFERQRSDFESL